MRILLVDDDSELIDLLVFAMGRARLEAIAAHDYSSALRQYEEGRPDLAVLDINLGGLNGLDLLKELRRRSATLPVIMLTALDSEEDKVRGLELGADDYLTKPFSHRELIARIRAQLRRNGQNGLATPAQETIVKVGPITLNLGEHSVTVAGEPVNLTVTEFRLLHCLMMNASRVVGTNELLKQVWGYPDPGGSDVVRVTLYRLRRKLEADPQAPKLMRTIPGVGVMLKADERD